MRSNNYYIQGRHQGSGQISPVFATIYNVTKLVSLVKYTQQTIKNFIHNLLSSNKNITSKISFSIFSNIENLMFL